MEDESLIPGMPYYFACPECGNCDEFFRIDIEEETSLLSNVLGVAVLVVLIALPFGEFLIPSEKKKGPKIYCPVCDHRFEQPSFETVFRLADKALKLQVALCLVIVILFLFLLLFEYLGPLFAPVPPPGWVKWLSDPTHRTWLMAVLGISLAAVVVRGLVKYFALRNALQTKFRLIPPRLLPEES